jgi:hypothetical protein
MAGACGWPGEPVELAQGFVTTPSFRNADKPGVGYVNEQLDGV